MKSILQSKKESYISEQTYGLEEHHIYFGTGKRKISDDSGQNKRLCICRGVG